jgi:aldehyde:ferredoxin oxidoreductase
LAEDPLPDGPAAGMVIDDATLERMKDAYYQVRGWDLATGIPTPDKLRKLDLEEVIPHLWCGDRVIGARLSGEDAH